MSVFHVLKSLPHNHFFSRNGTVRITQRWIKSLTAECLNMFQNLSLSPRDFRRLGSGERNPAEGGGPRGPSERERASHWAGVRASVNAHISISVIEKEVLAH